MTVPFVGLADLSAFTKLTIEEADALAIMSLDAACETIRTYIGQHVNLVRDDEAFLSGNNGAGLLIPELPVVQIHSVTVNGDEVTDWMVAAGGVLVRTADTRRGLGDWDAGFANVRIVYDHGWAVTEEDVVQDESGEPDVHRVPSDLRMIALRIAASTYLTSSMNRGIRQESIGSYSYTMDHSTASLTDWEKRLLDRYVVRKVPVP